MCDVSTHLQSASAHVCVCGCGAPAHAGVCVCARISSSQAQATRATIAHTQTLPAWTSRPAGLVLVGNLRNNYMTASQHYLCCCPAFAMIQLHRGGGLWVRGHQVSQDHPRGACSIFSLRYCPSLYEPSGRRRRLAMVLCVPPCIAVSSATAAQPRAHLAQPITTHRLTAAMV
jgi:hypothetical protein